MTEKKRTLKVEKVISEINNTTDRTEIAIKKVCRKHKLRFKIINKILTPNMN